MFSILVSYVSLKILIRKIEYEDISIRYGDSIGTLNVYLFNGSYTRLWSLSGNRGNDWYEGQVSYVSSVPHQILVEGIAGKDFLVRIDLIKDFLNLRLLFI